MIEIDGEFFTDVFEERKKEKWITMATLMVEIDTKIAQYYAVMHSPLFPMEYNGEVIEVNYK